MATNPSQINVAYIKHVSDDPYSDGTDEIMTAHAIQLLKDLASGTPPTIIEFINADLVDGVFTLPYESGVPILHVVIADENGDEVKVTPYFDPDGNFVSIDFSALGQIDGIWTASVWTATGPNPLIPSSPLPGGEADFVRAWGAQEISLMSIGEYSLYVVPANRSFCVRDLNLITVSCGSVQTAPRITLDVAGGNTLIDNEELPQERSDDKPIPYPVQPLDRPHPIYANHRYNWQIKESDDTVVEEGQILRLRITTPAIVTGDPMVVIVNVMGYLV